MKRIAIFIIFPVLALFSCKDDKRKALAGTWKAIKSENHYIDSVFAAGQGVIDTMGKNHDDSTNIRIYGTANMDSLRHEEQRQHDEALAVKDSTVKGTKFTFRENGIAVIDFGGETDSSKWTLDNEGNLIIESLDPADKGQVLKWRIANLTKDELKIVFRESVDSTLVTFSR